MKKILFFPLMLGALLCACSNNDPTPADTGAVAPEGTINALFSVSNSQQVYFSQGNLRYCPATRVWRFADNQYDYCGNDNSQVSDTYTGWIDLFGWGTGDCPTKTVHVADSVFLDYSTYVEWGSNPIENGGNQANLWRTPTVDEWRYLLYYRKNNQSLYGCATVAGVNGGILLPDAWKAPKGISFTPGNNHFSVNVYSADQWAQMEENGAIFLPSAGYRIGQKVCCLQEIGDYWSSSEFDYDDFTAYFASFSDDVVDPEYSHGRQHGCSVRLVRNR